MPERPVTKPFQADSQFVNQVEPSPNFGERRQVKSPDLIILHYTGMKSGEAALTRLCCGEAEVSSHYLIGEDGEIIQLVAEGKRAWHAGISCWKGIKDINSHSIGIEIVNRGHEYGYADFPDEQMESVVQLLGDIVARYRIKSADILAHSDIAPLRKQDPGELFDWHYLYKAGLGIWVEPAPIRPGDSLGIGQQGDSVLNYQLALQKIGFEIVPSGKFDELTVACTTAFQRHFRQEKVDGIADISTVETLNKLLEKVC
ncbi:MAG: N-acetylmuramoyl-L-alanine amidase [Hyphomicrobiales bacterium]|nr:N-acetylmuramoyl-L-alanine amidase [Hyphomicrobiales bacterium]